MIPKAHFGYGHDGFVLEALEMLPNNTLLVGIHGQTKLLEFQAIDLATCEAVLGVGIPTKHNDVEGIAWPAKVCAK